MMNKEAKKTYIEEMKKVFSSNEAVMITHYQGLNVDQLDELRKELRENGILFKITKNRITKIAVKDSPCKDLEKFSQLWYYNKCDKQKNIIPNYNVNIYNGNSEIPEKIQGKDVKANYETLLYYFWRYVHNDEGSWAGAPRYIDIKPSDNPYQFKFDLREDKYIKKEMQKTALLSYLLYEDGKIVIDEMSPKDKFGKVFTNETQFHSQSVGKSLASYILGHAICKGIERERERERKELSSYGHLPARKRSVQERVLGKEGPTWPAHGGIRP